ncbi:MAG: SDR family oxidoreductase, partial [Steroidobacteraceae bacterium]
MKRRKPRTVVVTGATAGLGRAVADAFVRRQWRVALIARGRERLLEAERTYRGLGAEVRAHSVDVADAAGLERAAAEIAAAWGGIDLWINNAMATVFAPFEQLSSEDYRRVIEVTFLGQVNGTRAALAHMRARNRGTIVQMSSALGFRSIPLQSAYCAAKAAVRGFTDALRCELLHEHSRVRLTVVYLPAINTPQFDWARSALPRRVQPVPPVFQPEAVAERVVRAAMWAPREVWIGRSTLQAALGNTAAPGWLDRLLARKAWDGQMTAERAPAAEPGNLYEPVARHGGSHGRVDHTAEGEVEAYGPGLLRAGTAGAAGLLVAALGWGA